LTDNHKNSIFVAFRQENVMSVRKVIDFVDRHFLIFTIKKHKTQNIVYIIDSTLYMWYYMCK